MALQPASQLKTRHTDSASLLQLCRVAEIAEQQGGKRPTTAALPQLPGIATTLAQPPPLQLSAINPLPINPLPMPLRPASPPAPTAPSIFSRMSRGFEQCADVTLVVEVSSIL